MKTRIILLSAVSMLALAACQKHAKVADNPNYNPDDNSVLTKLVLNISSASGSEQTKQTAQAVQAGGNNFRGMQDVHLLTYSVTTKNPKGEYMLFDGSSFTPTKDFDLGEMVLEGDVDQNSGLRILQLALPLETNAVMVYGRATRTGIDTDEKLGHVESTGTTVSDVTFSLKDRMNGHEAEFELFGDLMGRILTGVTNAGLEEHTGARGYKKVGDDGRYSFWWPDDTYSKDLPVKAPKDTTVKGITDPTKEWEVSEGEHYPNGVEHYNGSTGKLYKMYYGTVLWSDYGERYKNKETMTPLEEVLGEAYANIMTIGSKKDKEGNVLKELRSASSGSVLRLTQDLYGILARVVAATPTTGEEKLAQLMAQEIIDRAAAFFEVDASGNVSYKSVGAIMTSVDNLIPDRNRAYYSKITDDYFYREIVDDTKKTTKTVQVGFPVNLGMPLGSAIMTFVNPHDANPQAPDYLVVTYLTEVPAYGVGGGSFPITNYRYPAELMYYTNSGIRTANDLKKNSDFPEYTESWWMDGSWTGWTGGNAVKSTTQSVAVAKTINYGTALLATKVGYSAATIYDNNKELHPSEVNNSIDVDRLSNQFEVTGIMIGGVCNSVGWNFLPKTNDFSKMIYDDLSYDTDGETKGGVYIPRYNATESERYSQDIYTLTFDNYDSSKGNLEQNTVYIALELKNNTGQDLFGELNVIRKDGTFYLVGALDPKSEKALAKFYTGEGENKKIDLSRNDFNYPPFDASGNTINAPRVFMQDYVTTVKMNFTPTSLSHAYVTMPDLRSGQVSLGLSVDVDWESGYEFEINLGGATN